MTNNSKISLYVDSLIIETIAGNPSLVKNADGGMGGLAESVSNLFSSNLSSVSPNNRAAAYLNFIAPGAITVTFSLLNKSWIGILIGLAINVFKIDVYGILSTIYNYIRSALGSGEPLTADKVDSYVNSAVAEKTPPSLTQSFTSGIIHELSHDPKTSVLFSDKARELPAMNSDDGLVDDQMSHIKARIREARLVKLDMIKYEEAVKKNAAYYGYNQGGLSGAVSFMNPLSNSLFRTTNVLTRFLSIFFRVGLASAGLLVAGEAIRSAFGLNDKPKDPMSHNVPTTDTLTGAKDKLPTKEVQAPPVIAQPKQTRFLVNSNYANVSRRTPNGWIENYTNNEAGIESMLLDFSYLVYPDLRKIDSDIIISSPKFKERLEEIKHYNIQRSNSDLTVIPRFSTEKQIVDTFIDDVASKAP